jgi:hypothetical protein
MWVADLDLWMFVQSVWWSYCGCEYCLTMGKADWKTFNRRSITSWQTMEWSHLLCSDVLQHLLGCWVDELICSGQHITTCELCSTLSFSKSSVMMADEEVVCSKVCTRCVPQMLMDTCKETRLLLIFCINLSLELRASYHRLLWGMKSGSTILNLNQSGYW